MLKLRMKNNDVIETPAANTNIVHAEICST
jgi:hypothetical protein